MASDHKAYQFLIAYELKRIENLSTKRTRYISYIQHIHIAFTHTMNSKRENVMIANDSASRPIGISLSEQLQSHQHQYTNMYYNWQRGDR